MKSLHLKTSSSKGRTIATDLKVADTSFSRLKGLLGRKSLPSGEGLWIHRCNSIHTWFMKFPIDAVFVDRSLKVTHIYRNLKPWRITLPRLAASSVIELSAGSIDENLKPGDQLYVES